MIIARSQYDERPVMASDISFEGDKGVTKQSDAKDCDINAIFKRFERTGQLPDLIARDGRYGDFSSVPDFQEAMQIVTHAKEQFDNLDAHIRNRFDNDPAKFLAFATDEKNVDEMEKLGLLKPEAVKAREEARLAAGKAEIEKIEAAKKSSEQELITKIKAELNKPA